MSNHTVKILFVALSIAFTGCSDYKSNSVNELPQKETASKESLLDIKKSAESGNASSQFALGEIYRQGKDGIGKNAGEALNWYLKAALQRHGEAQIRVAAMYQNGEGVEKNMGEAINWYLKATENMGPIAAEAHFFLGEAYRDGHGTQANLNEAINQYKKAADLGNEKAKIELSKLLSK